MADGKLVWRALKKRSVDGVKGLVLSVAQDYESGEVLMAAFMDRQAFLKTLDTGRVHYYSTSRRRVWLKGESSGNTQRLKALKVDCDGDALLVFVAQKGGACHDGYRSCFYRKFSGGMLVKAGKRVFDPVEAYKR
ncbi:MAG: phosphoribosyl-AMP cyclohydrolase [Candidatus Altiarchaeota archaeon]|nr:phosphoribosyl-AMP cyclohydrolase [Candidatus Altiarchaeota archaeon]